MPISNIFSIEGLYILPFLLYSVNILVVNLHLQCKVCTIVFEM